MFSEDYCWSGCLDVLIEEYIQSRVKLFPFTYLQPKHHYLCHYPELMLQFGPLIRLWTLRFESKLSYFKQCMSKLLNFKILFSTLAETHQLHQAYKSAGNCFPYEIQVDWGTKFHSDYNNNIETATVALSFTPDSTVVTNEWYCLLCGGITAGCGACWFWCPLPNKK